jgi:hypothetical protein
MIQFNCSKGNHEKDSLIPDWPRPDGNAHGLLNFNARDSDPASNPGQQSFTHASTSFPDNDRTRPWHYDPRRKPADRPA